MFNKGNHRYTIDFHHPSYIIHFSCHRSLLLSFYVIKTQMSIFKSNPIISRQCKQSIFLIRILYHIIKWHKDLNGLLFIDIYPASRPFNPNVLLLMRVQRDAARYPTKIMDENGFYDIIIIFLFYQKIIDMS